MALYDVEIVKNIFKEDCKENKHEFSEKEFAEFVGYLSIDFVDWVQGNIKDFYVDKKELE
jgi:hypothetical protein